jgi:hypothetical protein
MGSAVGPIHHASWMNGVPASTRGLGSAHRLCRDDDSLARAIAPKKPAGAGVLHGGRGPRRDPAPESVRSRMRRPEQARERSENRTRTSFRAAVRRGRYPLGTRPPAPDTLERARHLLGASRLRAPSWRAGDPPRRSDVLPSRFRGARPSGREASVSRPIRPTLAVSEPRPLPPPASGLTSASRWLPEESSDRPVPVGPVPRRGIPPPLHSAFAVFHDLDGLFLSEPPGMFRPDTLLEFGYRWDSLPGGRDPPSPETRRFRVPQHSPIPPIDPRGDGDASDRSLASQSDGLDSYRGTCSPGNPALRRPLSRST